MDRVFVLVHVLDSGRQVEKLVRSFQCSTVFEPSGWIGGVAVILGFIYWN